MMAVLGGVACLRSFQSSGFGKAGNLPHARHHFLDGGGHALAAAARLRHFVHDPHHAGGAFAGLHGGQNDAAQVAFDIGADGPVHRLQFVSASGHALLVVGVLAGTLLKASKGAADLADFVGSSPTRSIGISTSNR